MKIDNFFFQFKIHRRHSSQGTNVSTIRMLASNILVKTETEVVTDIQQSLDEMASYEEFLRIALRILYKVGNIEINRFNFNQANELK